MKRFFATALLLGAASFPLVGLSGCEQKSEVTDTKKIETPTGSQTIESSTEVKKSGDMKDNTAPTTTTP